jgi:hypothetical protein
VGALPTFNLTCNREPQQASHYNHSTIFTTIAEHVETESPTPVGQNGMQQKLRITQFVALENFIMNQTANKQVQHARLFAWRAVDGIQAQYSLHDRAFIIQELR